MTRFLVTVPLGGIAYGFTIAAADWSDAERRIAHLSGARVDGILIQEIEA